MSAVESDNACQAILTLDAACKVRQGDPQKLASTIRRGAGLRVLTEFPHNGHLDPGSDNSETVHEVCDLQITYLLDNH